MFKMSCPLLLMLKLPYYFVHVPEMSPSLMYPWSFHAFLNVLEGQLARSNFSELRKPN